MKRESNLAHIAVLAVVIVAVLTLAVITVSKFAQFRESTQTQPAENTPDPITEQTRRALEDDDVLIWKGVRYVRRRGVESYLILGVDRTEKQIASGITNGQADVLLLLVLDPRESRYRVLQLNRDMISQIDVLTPGGYVSAQMYRPLCLAHAYATGSAFGCENTVRSVRWLLQDMPIDGYIGLNLESIGTITDAVGGVTVTIREDLTEADPSFTKGATVTLDAVTAERFVRARMNVGENDNLKRLERQKQFMNAWLNTAKSRLRQDPQFAASFLDALRPTMTTDLTDNRLSGVAADVGKYDNEGFLNIDGEYREENGFHYCYADEESLMETVIELFYQAEQ